MTTKAKKPAKRKSYTPAWHKKAYEVLKNYMRVYACRECGYPVVDGYCCGRCGTDEPY